MEYLFDEHGKVRKVFLKSRNRAALIEGLRRRFVFMGILNAIFAPLIVSYFLMYSFFRYFEVGATSSGAVISMLTRLIAIPQRPVVDRRQAVHTVRSVEVQGV